MAIQFHGARRGILAAAALAGIIVSSSAGAQLPYLEAFQGIYASNGGPTGPFTGVTGSGGPNNSSNPFTGSASFTGLDSSGNQQTMTIDGTAYSYSDYGHVHVYGAGTITNPYYNAANPVYVDDDGNVNPDGSPDTLSVHGNAGWGDTFTYTGFAGAGYKVNYYFKLDGIVSGDSAAGLNFSTSDPGSPSYNPRTTTGSELWITPWYDVNWGTPFDVFVDFFGGITSDVRSRPEGLTYTGVGNYSDTLTLAGIHIIDSNGNTVTDWNLTSLSGTNYPHFQPSAVPEPGSLSIIGGAVIGGLGILFRRRRA
jgi:hypothetical protein